MDAFSHEDPLLLVVPARVPAETALPRLLAHPDVRHLWLPAPWCLDRAGIDLPAALPACRTITLENLAEVVATLLRLCDRERLDELVARAWHEADERVRQHYLQLGVAQTFATIFRMAPRTAGRPPPPAFRRDRIHENGFEVQYRLAAEGERADVRAPDEEGSAVLYPFDPANEEARHEAGLPPGEGAVLEVFAYEPARERHLEFLERVAASEGWQALDPRQAR